MKKIIFIIIFSIFILNGLVINSLEINVDDIKNISKEEKIKNEEMMNSAKKIVKDYKEVLELQKKPLKELSKEDREKIIKFIYIKSKLSDTEMKKLIDLVKRQKKYEKERKNIIERKCNNMFCSYGSFIGSNIIKGKDNNPKNDTLVSSIIAGIRNIGK